LWWQYRYANKSRRESRLAFYATPEEGPYRRGYTRHTLRNHAFDVPVAIVDVQRSIAGIRQQFRERQEQRMQKERQQHARRAAARREEEV
jgi:hypothetical protein